MQQHIAIEFSPVNSTAGHTLPGEMAEALRKSGATVTMKSLDRPDGSKVFLITADVADNEREAFNVTARELIDNLRKWANHVGTTPVIEPAELPSPDDATRPNQKRSIAAKLPYLAHGRDEAMKQERMLGTWAASIVAEVH